MHNWTISLSLIPLSLLVISLIFVPYVDSLIFVCTLPYPKKKNTFLLSLQDIVCKQGSKLQMWELTSLIYNIKFDGKCYVP